MAKTALPNSLNKSCLVSAEKVSTSLWIFSPGTSRLYSFAFMVCCSCTAGVGLEILAAQTLFSSVFFSRPSFISSSATWKFVPPKPKADTLARRTLPVFHGSSLVITRKGLVAQSTVGFGVSKLTEGGNTLLYKAKEVLIKEAMPAAALAWPIWLFTLPRPMVPGLA